MALYTVNNGPGFASSGTMQNISTTLGAATGTLLSVTSETTTLGLARGYIFEISVGANGLPNATDCAIVWDLSAITAAGTASGTAMIPVALDASDVAGRLTADANYTAAGTITANSSRWSLAANQRASYRWVVNPGGPGEIVIPATDEAGYAVRATSSTYASTCLAEMKWRE